MHLALVQTLYQCRGSPEFAKISLTAMCVIAVEGVVCSPVLVGALFAPSHGLHFQVHQHLSFLFICTLHWLKHCTGVKPAPNLRKIPLTSMCAIAAERIVYRPVFAGAVFAPSHGLHFQAHQHLSFLFICTLHWCKHCTGLEVSPNLRKFPFTALCWIAARRVVCSPVLNGAPLCTNPGFTFSSSPSS